MRLIDADVFKKQVSTMAIKDNLNIEKIGAFLEIINQQPTAYDVEKVINQLSTKMFSAELHGDEWSGQTVDNLLCMGDVYEILKGEVKDD